METKRNSGRNGGRPFAWLEVPKGTKSIHTRIPEPLAEVLLTIKKTVPMSRIINLLEGTETNPFNKDVDELSYNIVTPIEAQSLKNRIKELEDENQKLESKCNEILDQTEKMIHAIPQEQLFDGNKVKELQQQVEDLQTYKDEYGKLELKNMELVQGYNKYQAMIKELESKLETEKTSSRATIKELEDKYSEFVQANTELANTNSDLVEEVEDSKTTIEALRTDIEKLEQDLNSLQSKQAEQKPQFNEPIEGVATRIIEDFHQKALETSATNPRYDKLRELLAELGYDWNKQGRKGWFSTLKRRMGK